MTDGDHSLGKNTGWRRHIPLIEGPSSVPLGFSVQGNLSTLERILVASSNYASFGPARGCKWVSKGRLGTSAYPERVPAKRTPGILSAQLVPCTHLVRPFVVVPCARAILVLDSLSNRLPCAINNKGWDFRFTTLELRSLPYSKEIGAYDCIAFKGGCARARTLTYPFGQYNRMRVPIVE